jgi:arabinofuranan 3-O-arabinosyltransferase
VETLDGGPEDVLAALDAGALPPARPVVVQSPQEPADVVSDGYRKVERQFGRIPDAVSEVMTGSDAYREERTAADYAGAPTVREAESEYLGGGDVRASSSQGYPDVVGAVLPAYGPAAAFDGRSETTWRSAAFAAPTGQWLDVRLDRPVSTGVLEVSFLDDGASATVRKAAVSFDGSSGVYAVPDGGKLLVTLPGTPVHDVRITVVAVAPGPGATSPVAISDVTVPGTEPGRTLNVPRPIGAETMVVLGDDGPRRACVDVGYSPHCETSQIRASEWNGLDRRLTVVENGTWKLSGAVVAQADAAAAALLGPLDDAAVVSAGSVLGGDPSVSGVFAFDGDPDTPWLADPADDSPALTLSWSGVRTISHLTVDPSGVPAARPVRARIETSAGVRDLDLNGLGFFAPLAAPGGMTITFYRSPVDSGRPLGVGELRVDGLDGLQHTPAPGSPTGAQCGVGPEVRIDGTVHRTEVTGTLGDILAGRPLTWRVCDGPVDVAAGRHRVVAESTPQFEPIALTWSPVATGEAARTPHADSSRLDIKSWGDVRRVMSVTSGPASVLRVAENVNDGWQATLDGKRLESVVLDGWQQGYRIPAGSAGNVVLEFVPDHAYRAALLGGAVLAALLVALALVAHPWARAAGEPRELTSAVRSLRLATAAAVGLVAVVLGGIPLALGWAAGLLRPVRRYAAAAGVVALVVSGLLVALSPGRAGGHPGAWADGTAALGVGLLLAQLVSVRSTGVVRRTRRTA